MTDYIGKEVYMGIRPENIHDEDVFIQAAPNAVVDCNVEVTELMGSETYLYLSTSGKEENIIARVNPRTTSRAGQKVQDCVRRQPPALLRQGDRDHAAYPLISALSRRFPFGRRLFF